MIMDVMEIQEIIPHRYPFLLLDRVTDIVKNETLVGYKNVTIGDNVTIHEGVFVPANTDIPSGSVVQIDND